MSRRQFLAAALLLAVTALLSGVSAAEPRPYSAPTLATAQKGGATIVVEFHADWCPTCRAQAPALRQLSAEKEFEKVVVLVADFDTESALKKALRVAQQSTIVVFKGEKEVARAAGLTSREELRVLIRKGL